MMTILGAIIFIAQLICCIAVKHRTWKYLPTLIPAGLMCVTVLTASLSQPDPQAMATETVMILAGGFAALLHLAISIIWNRMRDRK